MLSVHDVERLERKEAADVVRTSGTAPALTWRLTLDGREGACQVADASTWRATFRVGPEGGPLLLRAFDYGGQEIDRTEIDVPARSAAAPVPRDVEPLDVIIIER